MNKTVMINTMMILVLLSMSNSPAAEEISPATVPVDSGACCVDAVCAGDLPEPECLALGGTWYTDQECDAGFECPSCGYYVVGDWNGNGEFNIADIVAAMRWARCLDCPPPYMVCDCLGDGSFTFVTFDLNGTCNFNIGDIVWGWGKLCGMPNVLEPCPQCPPGPEPAPRAGNKTAKIPHVQFKAVISKQKSID